MVIKREKKEIVKLGFIGCGGRGAAPGFGMLEGTYAKFPDVEITWICDTDELKMAVAQNELVKLGRPMSKQTTDYNDIIKDPEVDAVVVYTGWPQHVDIALAAMKAGKYVGIEVGCAYDISECYELVRVYEETGSPLMMLENDCYSRLHLMALRMAREGVFGELVHCTGAYAHFLPTADLFKWITDDTHDRAKYWHGILDPKDESSVIDLEHYRQYEYFYRNAETYPTHEFGPISKILRINRGNRCLTISSFGSKAAALEDFLDRHAPDEHPLKGKHFKQSDIVTSVITCAGGETVRLTLDTSLPRPYQSGDWTVRGTRGCLIEEGPADKDCTIFVDGMAEPVVNNIAEVGDKYEHPLWAEGVDTSTGHGGLDWLTNRAFIEAVKAGTDTPIDAYDTATWMAIGPLSEMSIAQGGAPVSFPDFTRGKWFRREPAILSKYGLDEIYVDDTIRNDLSHLKK